jgi:hypothetical protein
MPIKAGTMLLAQVELSTPALPVQVVEPVPAAGMVRPSISTLACDGKPKPRPGPEVGNFEEWNELMQSKLSSCLQPVARSEATRILGSLVEFSMHPYPAGSLRPEKH